MLKFVQLINKINSNLIDRKIRKTKLKYKNIYKFFVINLMECLS